MSGFDELDFLELGEYQDVIYAIDWCGNESSCSYPLLVLNPNSVDEHAIPSLRFQLGNGAAMLSSDLFLELDISLIDMSGKVILREQVSGTHHRMEINTLPAGAFIIEAHDRQGRRSVFRFVKQ